MSDSSEIHSVTSCGKYKDTEFLKNLLRTSYDPLSDETILALNRDAEDVQHDADRIAAEISRVRQNLSELEKAHRNRRECIKCMKGLPAPIRRLPVELLGEIFSLTVESEAIRGYSFTKPSGKYECKLPMQTLRLSQVCHLWRRITMSSPLLWSFDKWAISSTRSKNGVINLVNHYLEMSKPLPLSLQLVTNTFKVGAPLKLLHIVFSHSARLRYLMIAMTPRLLRGIEEMVRRLGPCPEGGYFPNLEEADLRNYEALPQAWGSSVLMTDIFSSAPKLRSLVVDWFPSECSAFPLSQLEELTLGNFNELTDWEALSKLGLKKLVLLRKNEDFPLRWRPGSSTLSTVVCPSISSLRVQVDTDRSDCHAAVAMVCSVLSLPSLDTLHLCSDTCTGYEMEHRVVRSLITLPLSSLKELCIDCAYIPKSTLCELLRLVPGVTRLTYRCEPYRLGTLVDLLTVQKHPKADSPRQILLPALLHLEFGRVYHYDMVPITKMITSRWGNFDSEVASLESLTLTYDPRRSDMLVSVPPLEMQALRDAGFPLNIMKLQCIM